jgi:hypothetical protein
MVSAEDCLTNGPAAEQDLPSPLPAEKPTSREDFLEATIDQPYSCCD